uniref:Uncharacterized protein n=1 Tax=Glossina austeni TaxID=7395 RepID=A0A1A9VNQ3_GLOAU
MLAVKNFFLSERTKAPDTPQRFSRMPEVFLRSIRRRSLRVKRAKSLVVADREKRKSVQHMMWKKEKTGRMFPKYGISSISTIICKTKKKNSLLDFKKSQIQSHTPFSNICGATVKDTPTISSRHNLTFGSKARITMSENECRTQVELYRQQSIGGNQTANLFFETKVLSRHSWF